MLRKLLLILPLVLTLVIAKAQNYPARSNTLVTDYTATLADADKQRLEDKLENFADSTSTQIAVVLIKTTAGVDIDKYAMGLGKAWGIGQKNKNNGVVVLVATGDRKVSIQTGLGATGSIPPDTSKNIINNDILPRFRSGDFYGGLDMATSHLMNLIKNDFFADRPQQRQQVPDQQANANNGEQQQVQQSDSGGVNVGAIVIVVIIVIVIIIIIRGRNNGGGGGGQIIDRRGSASPFWWFLGGSLLGGAMSNWGNGWGNDDRNDGGGYSDGGSSDGGGFSDGGGDWGGFGGGDFGGDGSSGSW